MGGGVRAGRFLAPPDVRRAREVGGPPACERPKARKRLRRFERQLKHLQNCLGALNDIAVHERLAGGFVGANGHGRRRAFAIGVVSGREQSRIMPLREAAMHAAKRFAHVRPFWG